MKHRSKHSTGYQTTIKKVLSQGLPLSQLPKIIFLAGLFIFHIFLNHHADKNVTEIKKLTTEVGNLKAEYRTIHSDYRNSRLQSHIAKTVKHLGIIENKVPPLKIVQPNKNEK